MTGSPVLKRKVLETMLSDLPDGVVLGDLILCPAKGVDMVRVLRIRFERETDNVVAYQHSARSGRSASSHR